MELIKVDQSICTKCGICVKVCPPYVLSMGENGPIASKPEICIACGHCVAICPQRAIDNIRTPLSKQIDQDIFPIVNDEIAQNFLRSRRSNRCFKKMAVPHEQLAKLLNIARFAPTASNSQGLSYIVVENKEILRKAIAIIIEWMESQSKNLSHWSFSHHVNAYRNSGIDKILRDAPHLILAIAPKDFKNGRENTIFSLAYVELYATTIGLGTCWAGLFEMCAFANHRPLLDLFNIPGNAVFTGAVMVGYPQYQFKRQVDRNPLEVTWMA